MRPTEALWPHCASRPADRGPNSPEGRAADHCGVAPGVLRLPRRARDPPAGHEPDRIDLRHVRLRTEVTKGAGSRAAGLAMVFKLIESAQARWRAVNAPHLVALVRAGARVERGQLVERPVSLAA